MPLSPSHFEFSLISIIDNEISFNHDQRSKRSFVTANFNKSGKHYIIANNQKRIEELHLNSPVAHMN